MEERETTTEGGGLEQEAATTIQPQTEALPSTEFVKVEKNLASLGFFTPSSKRLRNAQEKSFTVTTITDGKRVELKGTIIPSAKYGLPITADQDKWIALCKIITDILNREGIVANPIAFTSADILRLLHKHRHSGKNYREVEEWLDVLFSTTIFSEGIVYLAHEKRRVKDRFRVFERAVSFGKELPDGRVADKNYVWLSDWQLQNINANHLLPIDLEAYREIKNHIAKALVPLLQIWLYATRDEGVFEKRYDELCDILNIKKYRYPSLITRTLSPSLDELMMAGYLAEWEITKTSDGDSYKIIFRHGQKFHRDRRARLSRKPPTASAVLETSRREVLVAKASPLVRRDEPVRVNKPEATPKRAPLDPHIDPTLLAELVKRGIAEVHARTVLAETAIDQPILDQLEWGDHQVKLSGGKITNPAGFYISLVKGNVMPPSNFETNARRQAREEEERRHAEEAREQAELEEDYNWYCQREIDRFISSLDPTEIGSVLEQKREENQAKYSTPWMIDQFAEQDMRRELGKRAPLITLEAFRAKRLEPQAAPAEIPVAQPPAPVSSQSSGSLENLEPLAREIVPELVAPYPEPMLLNVDLPESIEVSDQRVQLVEQTITDPDLSSADLIPEPPRPDLYIDGIEDSHLA